MRICCRKTSLIVLVIAVCFSAGISYGRDKKKPVSHSKKIGKAYKGPKQCAGCHEDAMKEVMSGAHYKFESEQPKGYVRDAAGKDVTPEKSGKLWKLCGFPTAMAQFNWLGSLKDDPSTPHVDVPGGCARCHVGNGVKPYTAVGKSAPTAAEHENVDCLMCHAKNYTRKYYIATENGKPKLNPLGSPVVLTVPQTDGVRDWSVYTEAAKSVGPTSAETCNRCHAGAGGGKLTLEDGCVTSFKRGSVFAPGKDVHADAGLTCSDCHYAEKHKFKRPLNNDLSAHDVVVDHQMCIDCHEEKPHKSSAYNRHVKRIACTTCHATATKAAVRKDFSVKKSPDPSNPLAIYKPGLEFASPAPIKHAWFNGTVGHEITALGSRGDGKIYPFRTIEFNQPVDKDNNPVPVKWGVFFKTGNMEKATEKGRMLYEKMVYSAENEKTYGIPKVPGKFDHFHTGHNGGFSVSHGITKDKALRCEDCHSKDGKLDFKALGYPDSKVKRMTKGSSMYRERSK